VSGGKREEGGKGMHKEEEEGEKVPIRVIPKQGGHILIQFIHTGRNFVQI
jgi:hypothetical protein